MIRTPNYLVLLPLLLLTGASLFAQNFPKDRVHSEEYYPALLKAAKEPVLTTPDPEDYAIRFILYRSLDPIILLRLQKEEGIYQLHTKQINGERAPEFHEGALRVNDGLAFDSTSRKFAQLWAPVRVLAQNLKPVPEETVNTLIQLLNHDDFFNRPALDLPSDAKARSVWVLEVSNGPRYHSVARIYPKEDWFRNYCIRLIDLSGLEIEYLY